RHLEHLQLRRVSTAGEVARIAGRTHEIQLHFVVPTERRAVVLRHIRAKPSAANRNGGGRRKTPHRHHRHTIVMGVDTTGTETRRIKRHFNNLLKRNGLIGLATHSFNRTLRKALHLSSRKERRRTSSRPSAVDYATLPQRLARQLRVTDS